MSKFDMKDLGTAKHFLGIEIKQECGKFYLNQTQYVKSILKRFNMQDCKHNFCVSGLGLVNAT
jgi:hypothetical protein